ncbi:MAG: FeoB-associated Cys-rich membrane protein [Verrucomicrobiales bacterium]
MNDWQSWAAGAIVLITIGVFVRRALRNKNRQGSCGSGCGCGEPKKK